MLDVVGQQEEAARAALVEQGFTVRTVFEENPDFEDGEVSAQNPAAGTELEIGEEVTLTVSSGQQRVAIPDVVGLSEADARSVLGDAGFRDIRPEPVFDPAIEEGEVVSLVSIGDLVKFQSQQQDFKIQYLTDYITAR